MSSPNTLRKPKLHFETTARPSHVTFDDGINQRRNLPWMHYEEARWDYAEPDVVRVVIADCTVVLTGHNLGALFAAIEEHTLLRVKAMPDLVDDQERDADTFVSGIQFGKPLAKKPGVVLS